MDKSDHMSDPMLPPVFTGGIYNVPADQPFLAAVARGVLDTAGADPLKLADITLLVPNHSVAQLLRQAFRDQLGDHIGILPRIEAPGAVDEDVLSLRMSGSSVLSQTLMDIPPSVTRLERQMILATEILKIPSMSRSLQKALGLARELGQLLDMMQKYGVDINQLNGLASKRFDQQWAKTTDFLKIITEIWPQKLQEMGRIDPEERRNAVLQIQAAHWVQYPPHKTVMAIGFSQDDPATQMLLQAVLMMPKGNVVLSGLDMRMGKTSWDAATSVHPQYIYKNILDALGAEREEVMQWPSLLAPSSHVRASNPQRTIAARAKLVSETMRPAATADGWRNLQMPKRKRNQPIDIAANDDRSIDPAALNGMDLLTCPTLQDEASVIALKFRETLELDGRTAMLVTADRELVRRVSARLRFWGITAQDTSGTPLSMTSAGVLLQATARMAADKWSPIPLLEVLKHPLTGLGLEKSELVRRVGRIEHLALRGPRPAPHAEGLQNALSERFNRVAKKMAQSGLTPEEIEVEQVALDDVVTRLQTAGAAFFSLINTNTPQSFSSLIDAHISFLEAVCATPDELGSKRLWRHEDGASAARSLTQIRSFAQHMPPMSGADYADVLQGLLPHVNVRPADNGHPCLKIVSPEQAMLQKADIVIVGGVNDGQWPRGQAHNPWLSADMLKQLGIPADAGIGISALQFQHLLSSSNVMLTRALRAGASPTVSSPFLTRLQMILKGAALDGEIEGKTRLIDINTALHAPAHVTPIEPPQPKPPVSARPKELPVTAIEALMRDPYSVYAKYILKLRAQPPIDAMPNVAEKGTFIHAALDRFCKKYPNKIPQNAREELIAIGKEAFKSRMEHTSVKAFWWPRYERIVDWFLKFEEERRKFSVTLGSEVRGKLQIDLGNGDVFTLTAIADRVDFETNDKLTLLDYKTGSVPAPKDIRSGLSPQLTLEALIACTGGFDGIDAREVGKLQYIKLSGARPAGEVIEVKSDVDVLLVEAKDGIEHLMRTFNKPETPYLSTPRPALAPRYRAYDHLSRRSEWSTVKKVEAVKKQRSTQKTPKRGKKP